MNIVGLLISQWLPCPLAIWAFGLDGKLKKILLKPINTFTTRYTMLQLLTLWLLGTQCGNYQHFCYSVLDVATINTLVTKYTMWQPSTLWLLSTQCGNHQHFGYLVQNVETINTSTLQCIGPATEPTLGNKDVPCHESRR